MPSAGPGVAAAVRACATRLQEAEALGTRRPHDPRALALVEDAADALDALDAALLALHPLRDAPVFAAVAALHRMLAALRDARPRPPASAPSCRGSSSARR